MMLGTTNIKITFSMDAKVYISKTVLGTKVNIVDVFNYEFPTPLLPLWTFVACSRVTFTFTFTFWTSH